MKCEVNGLSFVAKCFDDVHALLGIKLEPGTEQDIITTLEKFPEVAAAYKSLGENDVIALLTIESSKQLTEFVVEKIRNLKGVLDTKTTLIRK